MAVNQGEVEIQLNGDRVILRSTLHAAKIINATSQGFSGAFRRLNQFDQDVFVEIIAAGTGKRNSDDVRKIEEAVYRNGLAPLITPLSKYLGFLMNGGREPTPDNEAESDGKNA